MTGAFSHTAIRDQRTGAIVPCNGTTALVIDGGARRRFAVACAGIEGRHSCGARSPWMTEHEAVALAATILDSAKTTTKGAVR